MCHLKSLQNPCLILSCGQGSKSYISAWQVGRTVVQFVEVLCYKLEGHGYPDGIPEGVIGIIHWHNPSGYTMALGVNSASNRSKYQECFLEDEGGQCVGLTALTTFMCWLSCNLKASTSWNLQGLSSPVQGLMYMTCYLWIWMYTIGRKWHRIETVGRNPLSKPEPYIGCSAL